MGILKQRSGVLPNRTSHTAPMAPHSLGAAKHSALWQHIGLIGGTSQLPSKMILQERQPPIQHQLDARFDLPPCCCCNHPLVLSGSGTIPGGARNGRPGRGGKGCSRSMKNTPKAQDAATPAECSLFSGIMHTRNQEHMQKQCVVCAYI